VITPRQTRLLRVPNLSSFQRVLVSLIRDHDRLAARSCAVLVPSHAAAGQLRQTLEALVIGGNDNVETGTTLVLPDLLTRQDWYRQLHERLTTPPPLLDDLEREVLMGAAARASEEEGIRAPFKLRPGLITEIVRLYDELGRVRKTIDQFERLMVQDLEGESEVDRGAARLLQQTRFLVRTFRRYEARLSELGRLDEHRLRSWVLEHPLRQPYLGIIVAVGDRAADREGLWPADFDLLTRMPALRRIDVVATEGQLTAGFHERVHQILPGIEEERVPVQASLKTRLYKNEDQPTVKTEASVEAGLQTRLVAPTTSGDELFFRNRDREEELSDTARRLKQAFGGGISLNRTAVVFKRPLPYIYLAREVFGSAGIPHQALDALPLAAEPYAAAVDLIFDVVASGFSRGSMVALLRSPHFTFTSGDRPLAPRSIAGFDRRLNGAGYLGGIDQLRKLVDQWATSSTPGSRGPSHQIVQTARAALEMANQLATFTDTAPAADHLDRLFQFLVRYDRSPSISDPLRERHLRARAAIQSAITALGSAHEQIDNRITTFAEIAAAVRRWIEAQTFAPRAGSGGVHLVDAQTAPFGFFDEVHLVGLVETEWPDRVPRNIFFPSFLLQQLGWPSDAHRLQATRAAFRDLLHLAHERVAVSTFSLEDDAIVSPSVFLDDLEAAGLPVERIDGEKRSRVFPAEAISEDPVDSGPLAGAAAAWLALRQSRTEASVAMFRGMIGSYDRSPYSVGSLETYLECPFKFFAKHVLSLDEERDDEEARRPRTQGVFLHRVFQAFFEEWGRAGHRTITLDNLPEARSLFARVVTPLLEELAEGEAALERNRLFGTAAAEGLAEIVFRVEAESDAEVTERLLEHRLEGEFEMQGAEGPRQVGLTGVADRIDLLQDGTLRVIDYKSGRPPTTKRMLQLPIYSMCATRQLAGRHGRSWSVGEGGYIAFRDPRRFVALADRNGLDQVLADAQVRLLTAVDEIRAGRFPVIPLEPFRCTFCSYANVCRKDYVGDE
jgi:RecB family exonuclease/inactivated superfamily I helicase